MLPESVVEVEVEGSDEYLGSDDVDGFGDRGVFGDVGLGSILTCTCLEMLIPAVQSRAAPSPWLMAKSSVASSLLSKVPNTIKSFELSLMIFKGVSLFTSSIYRPRPK